MKTTEEIALLKNAGLKITEARLGVLDALKKKQKPLTVHDILSVLIKKKIAVDQATVYRILETFSQKKLISRIELHEGKFRYELIADDHHHLICQKCGMICDISNCPVSTLEKDILKKQKFLVIQHSLEFFGLCAHCQ